MTGRPSRFIYNNFFKTRDVFCLKLSDNLDIKIEDHDKIRISEDEQNDYKHYFFEIIDSDSGDVMGYTNLAVNRGDKLIWHDNCPIHKGEGFIYGSFVNERFRGRNLYVKILNYVTWYVKDKDIVKLVAVVESSNFPSARSHVKSGYKVCKKNYLIKFFKKNMLTIFNKPLRCYFAGYKSNSI